MATYNEYPSGGVSLGGVSAVSYEANVTATGGITLISRASNSQTSRPLERIGPGIAVAVGGTVSISLDRNPDPQG